jgi:hypothetical protein
MAKLPYTDDMIEGAAERERALSDVEIQNAEKLADIEVKAIKDELLAERAGYKGGEYKDTDTGKTYTWDTPEQFEAAMSQLREDRKQGYMEDQLRIAASIEGREGAASEGTELVDRWENWLFSERDILLDENGRLDPSGMTAEEARESLESYIVTEYGQEYYNDTKEYWDRKISSRTWGQSEGTESASRKGIATWSDLAGGPALTTEQLKNKTENPNAVDELFNTLKQGLTDGWLTKSQGEAIGKAIAGKSNQVGWSALIQRSLDPTITRLEGFTPGDTFPGAEPNQTMTEYFDSVPWDFLSDATPQTEEEDGEGRETNSGGQSEYTESRVKEEINFAVDYGLNQTLKDTPASDYFVDDSLPWDKTAYQYIKENYREEIVDAYDDAGMLEDLEYDWGISIPLQE